jgi:hypothetical protein
MGEDGLRRVPLDGGPETLLSPAIFDPATLALTGDTAYYVGEGGLWQVPLDGSGAPALVAPGAARFLGLGPEGQVVYSHDGATRYLGGAGDAWMGGTRLMDRGRLLRFSADGARAYCLEHAATIGTYGDLTTVALASGDRVTLGDNVHAFAELPDRRLIAIENAVYAGAWNRLVVIDQVAREKRWVAPEAADFLLLPGGREMVVDVVSGASGYDILRVPAPPARW